MKNVRILDCTLRDGGRIINCEYSDQFISGLAKGLTDARIDIVELGFLRSRSLVKYKGNSTFFTDVSQMERFVPRDKKDTMYVAFADFGMYDFSCLEKCRREFITGIRVGFTKKQLETERDEIKNSLKKVKGMGYALFVQAVNILGYKDKELLDLIDMVNEVKPYSFGIVDTYGAMYLEDVIHYYNLVDYNLNKNICIDVHSHNNFQSSFAFAQEIISLCGDKRTVIFDATLNGMGKCAGNLNTELIVDYLSRKHYYDYDTDVILDIIDRYLYPIKQKYNWGYSIPAFMAGLYSAHPNNIIYLTEKYRLNSKDIKYIISGIDENTRQSYDYVNIQKVYMEYSASKIDDEIVLKKLTASLQGKKILILVPGRSIDKFTKEIQQCIDKENPIVVSVNFVPEKFKCNYYFYANTIHWEKVCDEIERGKCIVTSNVHVGTKQTRLVDYSSLIEEDSELCDNSTIMLLNLLKKCDVLRIFIAGFDGLSAKGNNYVNSSFPEKRDGNEVKRVNEEIKRLYERYKTKVDGKIELSFITPSVYETP